MSGLISRIKSFLSLQASPIPMRDDTSWSNRFRGFQMDFAAALATAFPKANIKYFSMEVPEPWYHYFDEYDCWEASAFVIEKSEETPWQTERRVKILLSVQGDRTLLRVYPQVHAVKRLRPDQPDIARWVPTQPADLILGDPRKIVTLPMDWVEAYVTQAIKIIMQLSVDMTERDAA